MLISGHETRSMLERYNIVSLKNLRDAGEKLDAWSRQQKNAVQVPMSKTEANPKQMPSRKAENQGSDAPKAKKVRIPAMPITHSDLMAITIPSDADHRRSEATLGCSYHAEVIGIRQAFCGWSSFPTGEFDRCVFWLDARRPVCLDWQRINQRTMLNSDAVLRPIRNRQSQIG